MRIKKSVLWGFGMVFLRLSAANAVEPAFSSITVPLPVSSGRVIPATLRIPRTQPGKSRIPAMLVFGGFESAGRVLDLIHPEVPVALASFDYPFEGARDLRFPDGLKALPQAKRLFPETEEGIAALIRALKRRPEIDPNRIVLVGASFGSPFVVAAAARNPDVAGVAIVQGFGQVPEVAENAILRSWVPRYGWIARPAAWLISRALWLYLDVKSPETYARHLAAKQKVLMITAQFDSFIPRAATDSLWSALQESPAQLTREDLPSDHLMPGSDELIRKIMKRVQLWNDRCIPESDHDTDDHPGKDSAETGVLPGFSIRNLGQRVADSGRSHNA